MRKWEVVPRAIKRQVLFRSGIGIVLLFLFFLILGCWRDIYLGMSCLLFSIVLLGSGGILYCQGAEGKYICIQGICRLVETTGVRKRVKRIVVTLDQNTLKIPVWQGMIRPVVGDMVLIYLSERTPVYGQDGDYTIASYYAMEIIKAPGTVERNGTDRKFFEMD